MTVLFYRRRRRVVCGSCALDSVQFVPAGVRDDEWLDSLHCERCGSVYVDVRRRDRAASHSSAAQALVQQAAEELLDLVDLVPDAVGSEGGGQGCCAVEQELSFQLDGGRPYASELAA